jgi:hypothetical protein
MTEPWSTWRHIQDYLVAFNHLALSVTSYQSTVLLESKGLAMDLQSQWYLASQLDEYRRTRPIWSPISHGCILFVFFDQMLLMVMSSRNSEGWPLCTKMELWSTSWFMVDCLIPVRPNEHTTVHLHVADSIAIDGGLRSNVQGCGIAVFSIAIVHDDITATQNRKGSARGTKLDFGRLQKHILDLHSMALTWQKCNTVRTRVEYMSGYPFTF